MAEAILKIEGMSCNHCVMAVTKALKAVPGVKEASVDLKAKQAAVAYDENVASIEKMKEAIEEEGYDVVG